MNPDPATGAQHDDAAAAAARAALFPGAAAARADTLAAQFDAWLALTGQVDAGPGATVRLPMLTGSMHPALPRGCTLLIAPLGSEPARRLVRGDVAVFARSGRLVAHRVLLGAMRGGAPSLLEMGDANRRGTWRPAADAVGLVIGAEDARGHALPSPASRRQALRNLFRHAAAIVLGIGAQDEGTSDDVSTDDTAHPTAG